MSKYIKNHHHFVNFINCYMHLNEYEIILTDKNDQEVNVVDMEFLLKKIYDTGLADRFCWEVKQDHNSMLSRDNVYAFVEKHKGLRAPKPYLCGVNDNE